ncbi:MAG TPA: class I SAM-dependent methyltransferase [Steroidobacteraceae bacterium]
MTPEAVVLREQHRLVAGGLGDARRVLEVGCGHGALAAMLAGEGREVTAVDLMLPVERPSPAVRWIEGHFVALSDADFGDAFDAVAFTTSLHHIAALDDALARAESLLRPGGRLVLDEFDLAAPDAACARWYYDVQELLAAAGAYPADRIDDGADAEPRARWLAAHEHHGEPPLHPGASMITAVEARFDGTRVERGPYLYRYICGGLDGPHAGALAETVLALERRRITSGLLPAVGLALTAARRWSAALSCGVHRTSFGAGQL